MKIQTLSELIVTAALGCISGLSIYGSHLKWQRLGLAAYLDQHAKTYQTLYAKPVTSIHELILWTTFAYISYATFKGLSVGLAALIALVYHPESEQPLNGNIH